jgi:response regulator NasT
LGSEEIHPGATRGPCRTAFERAPSQSAQRSGSATKSFPTDLALAVLLCTTVMTDSPPLRVLLAEDDATTRELLVEVLAKYGYVVVADVGDGREAIARARTERPDIVLLDVHMPDATGIEAARDISAELPETAVVLITADATLSLSREDVESTRAITVLHKPIESAMLDSQLRLAAEQARVLTRLRREAADARQALEARKTIERAKGILMRRTGCSEQDAYRILQRSSQDRSQPMVAVAQAVLDSEPGMAAGSR